jgi:hypothetical protein
MFTEDEIRDKILRHLYERHRTANGRESLCIGVRELQQCLKPIGIKRQQVNSNLDYLVQKEWVRPIIEPQAFMARNGMIMNRPKTKYKISDKGIDLFQKPSIYNVKKVIEDMNVFNIGGVTVVGDGNVVNAGLIELARSLDDVRKAALADGQLSNDLKLEATGELNTIQSQIHKITPNKRIIEAAWHSFEDIARNSSVLLGLCTQVGKLLGPIIQD